MTNVGGLSTIGINVSVWNDRSSVEVVNVERAVKLR